MLAGLAALSLVIGNWIAWRRPTSSACWRIPTVSHVGSVHGAWRAAVLSATPLPCSRDLLRDHVGRAVFGAIIVLPRRSFEADRIDDFKGLSTHAARGWLSGAVRDGFAGGRAAVPRLLQSAVSARGHQGAGLMDRRRRHRCNGVAVLGPQGALAPVYGTGCGCR